MIKEEFFKCYKYLSVAYDKKTTQEQAEVWYDFFKEEDFNVFKNAIRNIIKRSKYMPSISELLAEIDYIRASEIIDYMNKCGTTGDFKYKIVFYYQCDDKTIDLIKEVLNKGYSVEEIKERIYKVYSKYVDQYCIECEPFDIDTKCTNYKPERLFGINGSIYFINE